MLGFSAVLKDACLRFDDDMSGFEISVCIAIEGAGPTLSLAALTTYIVTISNFSSGRETEYDG
jgi:hypothetical protein